MNDKSSGGSILRLANLGHTDAVAAKRIESRTRPNFPRSSAYQAPEDKLRTRSLERGVAHTINYRPPEYDTEAGPLTKQYDTWSLGCIFLEVAVWMMSGAESLKNFQSERATTARRGSFEDEGFGDKPRDYHKIRLREAVVSRLSSLESRDDGIVRRIARIIPQMLSVNPETRLTAKQVIAKL